MRKGDISNKTAPAICFDIDSLLFEEVEETNILKKLFKIKKREVDKPFNQQLLSILDYFWKKHDLIVYLISFSLTEKEIEYLFERLINANAPFTNIIYHQEWEDVFHLVENGRYQYLFSSNEELLKFIGRNAYHIQDYRRIL